MKTIQDKIETNNKLIIKLRKEFKELDWQYMNSNRSWSIDELTLAAKQVNLAEAKLDKAIAKGKRLKYTQTALKSGG